ncbi:MAG: hypothetical protein JZU65_23665 [Chlorobium sp.]|nr:hypothetical protein [Chlorobium sp.]
MQAVITNHQAKIAQTAALLAYLRREGSISTPEGRNLGIMHVAGRIQDLRKQGHIIETRRDRVATTPGSVASVARYYLTRERGLA